MRRQLGVAEDDFDRQIAFVQQLFREAKRASIYWLSIMHYDDGNMDNAKRWLANRVLDAGPISSRAAGRVPPVTTYREPPNGPAIGTTRSSCIERRVCRPSTGPEFGPV